MKILAIRMKNLASLAGETVIDFTQEPLSSAGIFAITGPTGAGKSTILDALCLALYAKTPRYTEAKETGVDIRDVQGATITQGDIRGILRRGSAEGFAEVDFVGTDGNQYKAQWNIRRARNKAEGTLQAYQISLKNITSNSDVPGTKTELLAEIERLVGLNFDQFTRSVLLAQGDFTAFLKAVKDEKAALLEKLTGTHIYSEISRRIFEKQRDEAQELRELNLQRNGIPTLTTEETTDLTRQKKELEQSFVTQENQVTALKKEIDWHEQLIILQNNKADADAAFDHANKTKKEAAEREQKLKLAETAQSARTFIDGRNNTDQKLTAKYTALNLIKKELSTLADAEVKLLEALKTAEEDLGHKAKAIEEAKPLLDEAKALDVQLAEKKEQVEQAKNEADAAKEKLVLQQKQVKAKEDENESLQNSITALKKWKTDNLAKQPIADNKDLILSKLTDAQQLLDEIQESIVEKEKTEEAVKLNNKEKDKLQKLADKQQTALQAVNQTYAEKLSEVSAVAIDELEQQKTATDAAVEELITADAHWKLLWTALNDKNALSEALATNRKVHTAQKKQLANAVKQLETAKKQYEASQRMLDKARLATAENVEALRSNLISGDPCPVCGSMEHPYANENPQLNHVLAELEETHQQYETTYTHSLTTHSSLNESVSQLLKTIETQETELSDKESKVSKLQDVWGKLSIYKLIKKQIDQEKTAWLKDQLSKKKVTQKKLQEQIKFYYLQKEETEKLKEQLSKSEKQVEATNEAIKEIDRKLNSQNEVLERNSSNQQQANALLDRIKEALLPSFSSDEWLEQWKNNPEKFVQGIETFTAKWKETILELETLSAQQGILEEAIAGLKKLEEQLLGEADKKKENESIIINKYNKLIDNRKNCFNGEAVYDVETRLNQALETAQQILGKRNEEQEQWKKDNTRANTQKEQTQDDITELEQQKTGYTNKIAEWLLNHNKQNTSVLDVESLENLLLFSAEWIEAERLALRTIDDALAHTKSVLDERKKLLQQHEQLKISETPKDELIKLHQEAKEILLKTTQDKTEIEIHLKQDEVNKQKIGDLLKTLEAKSKVVEHWAKLNELIGSADGKKFRQIAQEYTLEVLLRFTNVHLELLSKRYLLQRIPGTLGLQVLDQDMGNEVRTVFSLSGGESFLVSLALALGLASLSSSRMQVESLFIDEGFGSLDPNTLNIAMDALERLHNQGRKVGVISHVQEMTERIPVQIKVSKQNSGRSLVEVI